MNLRRVLLAAIAAFVFASSAFAVSTTVVISEFRVRGPNGAADEFIELLNISSSTVDISGWKVNGSSNAGAVSTRATIPANTTLGAGCHYLLTNSSTSGGPYSGSVAGSQTYATGIADDGGIALLNASGTIVDQVGMSSGSAYKEGTPLASLGTTNTDKGYARKSSGTTDNDTNSLDFVQVAPTGPENGCAVTSTAPTGSAAVSPTSAAAGDSVLLTVTVTPGASPASSGIAVKADLTPIGGVAAQALYDDATHGDTTAGDNKFAFSTTVAAGISGGAKTLTSTITDAQSRSGSASTTLTVLAPTALSGTGAANPASVSTGSSTLLTVAVTPGTNPASSGVSVIADLRSIGGSSSQSFYDDGTHGDATASDNTWSYSASIPVTAPLGAKSLAVSIADAQSRTATATIALTVNAPTIAPGTIVISQVYGGGGNTDATLKNDFIELFNRSSSAVLLDGWSVQYYSSTSATWSATPLSGVIQPHAYYLVQESQGSSGTVDLPTPDATGTLFLGATSGRVALVQSVTTLTSACPTGATIIDFVGYGNASCAETKSIGLLTNTTGALRLAGGCTDTNNNSVDFKVAIPAARNSSTTANDCGSIVTPAPTSHLVISQVYGGGGNSGAYYGSDYVELYNPTTAAINLNEWSVQYASATGSLWNSQPLGGTIQPGEYFLIQFAGGTNGGAALPSPRIINADIGLGSGSGKVALVNKVTSLTGNCPIGDPLLVDLVGYGAADCYEGGLNAPAPSNTVALLRANSGVTDTNQNSADFATGAPNPRGGGPLVDLLPRITSVDPAGADAPRDLSVTIGFSEPVSATGIWYSINCSSSGPHGNVEVASALSGKSWIITPNMTFEPGETCMVHVFASQIVDLDGQADNLPADVEWTFTIASGAPVETADVHLTMGNPSNATLDDPDNYLMEKPEYALSYNRSHGTANWVSWHLTDDWTGGGSGGRTDTFRPDPALPREWYRVLQTDYAGSGFDRGHMSPSADRTTTVPINQATFLMSNMVPQSPDNNQGPWEQFEAYLRTLLPSSEVYIVSGPDGVGGAGSNGAATTIANGHVTVPANTWKVALVLPKLEGNDITRVSAATRTIAIRIPNMQGIKSTPWTNYLTTVRNIEQITGYDFFSAVPKIVQNSIEPGLNGTNPPGVANQTAATAEDQAVDVSLNAVSPDAQAVYTWTLDSQPSHGALTGSAPNVTYTPAADFNGSDSFTFHVNDGHADSVVAAVSIPVTEVNDTPTAGADSVASVEAGSSLQFAAKDLISNDSAGPSNESAQSLTVTAVTATAGTHGNVSLANGQVTYTPAPPYTGAASFTYTVCDNGTTAGTADPRCTTGSVSTNVLDTTAPVISSVTPGVTQLWPANHQMIDVTIAYTATDVTDASPLCTLSVFSNEPIDGAGDGDMSPDWQITDAHHVRLRAERAGTGSGRVYTIAADCADRFGNAAHSGNATVIVPKSQR